MSVSEMVLDLGKRARAASRGLALLSTDEKNRCLIAMAEALEAQKDAIKAANEKDLAAAPGYGLSAAMMDRLKLDEKRIASMAKGLREVAALPDPVGRMLDERVRPNGLKLRKVSTPIGVVVIIYESRPNVTADAASLCFKSGNATILRGGKEALHSNMAIAQIMIEAGKKALANFPMGAIQVVPTTDREAIKELLSLTQYVDLCMPRGGEGLIRAVAECSKVPVIKHYKGVCHLYVDRAADPALALRLAIDGKLSRPGVCNSLETMLVHADIADSWLPGALAELQARGAEIRGCERTRTLFPAAKPATGDDYDAEFLAPILAVRVVDSIDQAIAHIHRYTSDHTEVIVTTDKAASDRFIREIRSSAVVVNASSRFNDGGALGLGAEIGISTTRLHAYGPMGLESLTIERYVVRGEGQVRHPDVVGAAL